jgi:porin
VPQQLYENDMSKNPAFRFPSIDSFFQSWFDWKRGLKEDHHFQFGTDYATLFQTISGSETNRINAMSGIYRLFGKWTLTGRGTKSPGNLVVKVEHRHKIGGETVPADIGFAAGFLGVPGTLFSDAGAILGDIYWGQTLNEGKTGAIIGRFDPNDFQDVLGYASPWTGFQNVAVMINASVALPDWSYGVGAGSFISDHIYAVGTINDANGTTTDLNFFSGGAEFYKQVTIARRC